MHQLNISSHHTQLAGRVFQHPHVVTCRGAALKLIEQHIKCMAFFVLVVVPVVVAILYTGDAVALQAASMVRTDASGGQDGLNASSASPSAKSLGA
jgi:hypothetical protein